MKGEREEENRCWAGLTGMGSRKHKEIGPIEPKRKRREKEARWATTEGESRSRTI